MTNPLSAKELFVESFEGRLEAWELVGAESIQTVDSGTADHGNVMQLNSNGEVYALIKNSAKWGAVRIEGEVFFPDDEDNYLGLIYNYSDGTRRDFGSIYIKGNESYLAVNPWRDGNASRLLYPEYKIDLSGAEAIRTKTWHKFKAEIVKNICHFYVNDNSTPKITFDLFEHSGGMVGFKPRIVGSSVWIDNIRVTSIESLNYKGEKIPNFTHQPEVLLKDWQYAGPFSKPNEPIEKTINYTQWKQFNVDERGAVITGRVTEYRGERTVAYFRTLIQSDQQRDVILHITTADELALFLNNRFISFIYRDGYVSGNNDWNVWFDFWKNPQHAGRKVPIRLNAG
ncbi:MAG TPA: hypothetical protein VLH08_06265, partial [Acidobacteriota bacterium]|nr:hypothetical protein [Acidobacteriota bacterium]